MNPGHRYQQRFSRLDQRGEAAFAGFLVLGDPSPAASLDLMRTLVRSGSDMLELGFPFSDPLADGPVIQEAMQRGLHQGMTPGECFRLIGEFRQSDPETPIGLLVYANLVCAWGMADFYRTCQSVGVDSVLVADAPLVECEPFCQAARQADIDPVLLCPPNISRSGLESLARLGGGYTYLLSRAGVTGTTVAAGRPVDEILRELHQLDAPRPLLGFGISEPRQVKAAWQAGAAGVICGSAIIQRIAATVGQPARMLDDVGAFIAEMKAATRKPGN